MPPKVTVMMNNVDITSTTYRDGVLAIPNVTGDVTIKANADRILWHVGTIDTQTGEIVDATDRIYSDLIDASGGVTVTFDNYHSGAAFCPIYYNEDKSFAYAPDNFMTDSLTLFPGQYAYVRLVACSQPSVYLTPDFALNLTVSVGTAKAVWASGIINAEDGTNKRFSSRIRTGFFDIRNGDICFTATYGEFIVYFYDENMNFQGAMSHHFRQYDFADTQSAYHYKVQKAAYVRIVVRVSATLDAPMTKDYGERNIQVTFTKS
jgi:hypothetical protein